VRDEALACGPGSCGASPTCTSTLIPAEPENQLESFLRGLDREPVVGPLGFHLPIQFFAIAVTAPGAPKRSALSGKSPAEGGKQLRWSRPSSASPRLERSKS
jgi:hypothetical protein